MTDHSKYLELLQESGEPKPLEGDGLYRGYDSFKDAYRGISPGDKIRVFRDPSRLDLGLGYRTFEVDSKKYLKSGGKKIKASEILGDNNPYRIIRAMNTKTR